MDVTPENVVIKAKTAQGLFYGMQSFIAVTTRRDRKRYGCKRYGLVGILCQY